MKLALPSIAALACLAACGRSSAPPAATDPTNATAAVPDGPGEVETHHFHSDALGVDKDYVVYLPAGYAADPARRYPVIYMLHGLGGNETMWAGVGKLAATADQLHLQAIVVMPDGDAGFWANGATKVDRAACLQTRPIFSEHEDAADYCVETPAYEDYVIRDLIGHVDATYRTIAERGGRGIGGLSMGGFGALQLAMRHPDLFVSTASHSGVDALLYAGPWPYQAGKVVLATDVSTWGRELEPIGGQIRGIFGADLANWQAHDPAVLAGKLADGDLAIYLDCGTEDDFQLHNGAQYLHDILTERGVSHEWYLGPGKHDFVFWHDRLDDSLRFHMAAFAATKRP
jgi:S-formylglutathione hydrolase FrmB